MWRAIKKYGWDNVQHEILCKCESKQQAEELERRYICEFQTQDPMFGYNILPGGDVSVNDATPEMRHKLGNGKRGVPHTEEEKEKISEGVKRAFNRPESNGCIGRKTSEETKEKMRTARAAYLGVEENWQEQSARSSAVMDKLWKDEEFRRETLDRLARYRRKPGEWHPSEETKQKIAAANKGKWLRENGAMARPVVQLTKEGEFVARYGCIISAAEAVSPKTVRSTMKSISKCCRRLPNFNTCHGYKWMWAEDYYT